MILKEIKINQLLNNPFIVSFYHYFEDLKNIYLIFEICENKTLKDLLKKRKRLTEIEVQYYLYQLIEALKYLHSKKIIHRDLKLSNLFLTENMVLKLGDFGLSTISFFKGDTKTAFCGTPNYIAPEILDKEKGGYSYEIDIWSVGVIMYELIIGTHPFGDSDNRNIYNKIYKIDYYFPKNIIISNVSKDLIRQILKFDPKIRPSLDQILNHYFFKLGKSIPKSIPISTLKDTPSLSYIREYMPDADENGIVNKSISENNLINDKSNNKNIINNIKEELNPKCPDIWIKKWVDYSRFGIGYKLNNNNYGVYFNDKSKMVLNEKKNVIYYIDSKNNDDNIKLNKYNIDNYPKEIEFKIKILQNFKKYFDSFNDEEDENENLEKEEDNNEESECLIYLKNWAKSETNYIFRLYPSKNIEIFFDDKSHIIFSKGEKDFNITYFNKKNEHCTYIKEKALEDYKIRKKFKFGYKIMNQMAKKTSNVLGEINI